MNGVEVFRQTWSTGRNVLDQQMANCTEDAWVHRHPGSAIESIGSIFAHIAYAEDNTINKMLQGKQTIWVADNWESTTGMTLPEVSVQSPAWASLDFDMDHLKEYANEVKLNTERYLATLTDADLDRKVETGFAGQQTVGWALTMLVDWHVAVHSGEIAALFGIQGMKGLPF